jgi:drug/metabolite transporter (DMT)-like permease
VPLKTIVLILSIVAFSVAGQLLLKAGAQQLAGLERLEFPLAAARNPHILAGLLAWTISTLGWISILQNTPLSKAYLLNSLTYVLTPLLAVFLFGESVGRFHIVGTVLILIGVAFVLSGK